MFQPKYYWYIASPYSAINNLIKAEVIRDKRYRDVLTFTAWAMKGGMVVYSPIVHCHEIARIYSLPTDADFWRKFNEKMILAGGGMIVLCLEGWKESKGVQMEIALAYSSNMPVLFAVIDHDKYALMLTEPR